MTAMCINDQVLENISSHGMPIKPDCIWELTSYLQVTSMGRTYASSTLA